MDTGRSRRILSDLFPAGLNPNHGCGRSFLLAGLLLAFLAGPVWAVDPGLEWRTLESAHFRVHYARGHEAVAQRTLNLAADIHARLSRELDWVPQEKTDLVLSDESDTANGYATPLHFNRSVLFLAPPLSPAGLEDFDDWLSLLLTHEYTHVLHLDRVSRAPAGLRKVFGRFLLLFPNLFEPLWLIEGLATWKETDLQSGVGRGQSSLYAMHMRNEVAAGIKPVSQVNLPINSWPGGTTRYLYGVYFMLFLEQTRGEAAIHSFVDIYSGNLLPFAINSSFRQAFGMDVRAMWQEFERWLQARFGFQLAQIEAHPLREGTPLTEDGYANRAPALHAGRLYFIRNRGYHQAELVRMHPGRGEDEVQALFPVQPGASFDINAHGDILLSQPELCEEYNYYNDLYLYREADGELERITECGRYVRAHWLADGSLLALRHEAGSFSLQHLDATGGYLDTVWLAAADEIISDFDVSPDGRRLVAARWRPEMGWNLEEFDIDAVQWRAITSDRDVQGEPEYYGDAEGVFYSADYDGVYNLYYYEQANGQHYRLSNVRGGAFQPAYDAVGKQLYYRYGGSDGQDIYNLQALEYQALEYHPSTPLTKTRQPKDAGSSLVDSREYTPWHGLRPRWWFPVLAFTEEQSVVGLTTSGHDALAAHNYALNLAMDLEHSFLLGAVHYAYSNRFGVLLARDSNLFLDASGRMERLRTADSLQLTLALPRSRLLSQHLLVAALALEHSADRERAPGVPAAADFDDNVLAFAWLYNSSRRYPFSISLNDGMSLKLSVEDNDTLDADFSGQVYTLDWKQYLRTGRESVLALRFLQGWGTDAPSLFRLGGEDTGLGIPLLGNGGLPLFGKRSYALRGYPEGLPQLRGRRAQLLSAEWRLPGARVERGLMSPPLGLMQWYASVFLESGSAYDDSPAEYYSSAGIEINADLNLFYSLPMTLRMGYAHGFNTVLGDDRVYLSLGASF